MQSSYRLQCDPRVITDASVRNESRFKLMSSVFRRVRTERLIWPQLRDSSRCTVGRSRRFSDRHHSRTHEMPSGRKATGLPSAALDGLFPQRRCPATGPGRIHERRSLPAPSIDPATGEREPVTQPFVMLPPGDGVGVRYAPLELEQHRAALLARRQFVGGPEVDGFDIAQQLERRWLVHAEDRFLQDSTSMAEGRWPDGIPRLEPQNQRTGPAPALIAAKQLSQRTR
ncbi:MAG: hypothetical protein AVDCRST_MAG71-1002 [uncultured Lysobacter sp.]|uniref:Uncharacterized protein n=1 Tax=uncultured Lysobacter sp. TaxID=271060 RepID=A0A6J4KUU6_9GAMM|nr:MAG: hypothetical protein AVDCRST_MAG71-1002 [uncultured Lysobacter sp.]